MALELEGPFYVLVVAHGGIMDTAKVFVGGDAGMAAACVEARRLYQEELTDDDDLQIIAVVPGEESYPTVSGGLADAWRAGDGVDDN